MLNKKIIRSKRFKKNYKRRYSTKKYQRKIIERLGLFINDRENVLLKDHVLKGTMSGYRSFSISGDIRIIYQETKNEIILVDIGTHNQIY